MGKVTITNHPLIQHISVAISETSALNSLEPVFLSRSNVSLC